MAPKVKTGDFDPAVPSESSKAAANVAAPIPVSPKQAAMPNLSDQASAAAQSTVPYQAPKTNMAKMENESGVSDKSLDAAAYASTTGKDISTYPDFAKLTPAEAKYAQQKAEVNQKIIKADTSGAGKLAQGIVNTLPSLPLGAGALADVAGGAPGMTYLASGGAFSDPRRVGYGGPEELLNWKGKPAGGPVPTPAPVPTPGPVPGPAPAPIDTKNSGGPTMPDVPGQMKPTGYDMAQANLVDEAAKPKKDVDWNKIWGMVRGGILGIADVVDVLGSAKRAYAGKESPTRLQQQFKNRLVMEQQAAQAKSAAEAEITKYEPQVQAQIKQIRAEYDAMGNKDVFVSKMNQLRNLKLIDEQTYVAMMNSIGAAKFSPGGATSLANDLTQKPGGMPQ
jgi:hypothetical protein